MPRLKSPRAKPVPPRITPEVAALAKGMLVRGDRQSDIASYFGFNQGRMYDLRHHPKFKNIPAAQPELLPEPGPYIVVSRVRHDRAVLAESTLATIMSVLNTATDDIRSILSKG